MPVIFVHGVNVRKGPAYDTRQAVTKKLLQQYLCGTTINGKTLGSFEPEFPFWGDLATTFAWNMDSLPRGQIDSLGSPQVHQNLRSLVAQISDAIGAPSDKVEHPLRVLANKDLGLAVDVMSQLLAQEAKEADVEKFASFIVASQGYALSDPHPTWLATIATDAQLINRLAREVKSAQACPIATEGLGAFDYVINPLSSGAARLRNAVKLAAGNVWNRGGDFASTNLVGWARESLNKTLGQFFGDIFIYFNGRGNKNAPGDIPSLLLRAFDEAVNKCSADEPLVIIGHSLGGVITFDLLSHFTDRQVDLLVTVGSQVPHFEEIKLFHASDKTIPNATQKLATTSSNIKRWINVFDVVDIFSYSAKRIFDRVEDFQYDTKTHTVKAHGAYFDQDRLYYGLRQHIDSP